VSEEIDVPAECATNRGTRALGWGGADINHRPVILLQSAGLTRADEELSTAEWIGASAGIGAQRIHLHLSRRQVRFGNLVELTRHNIPSGSPVSSRRADAGALPISRGDLVTMQLSIRA